MSPAEVIDREAETERLLELAAGGHYVRLYAPRRYGKTSLLLKALEDAGGRHRMVAVLADLYGVLSLADVTVRIERAYATHLTGKLRPLADRLLAATGLGLSLGAYGISVRLQLERHTDPLPALHALLELPVRLHERNRRRALIVFDEFQDVLKVAELEAILRSHIQFHGDAAAYVFSGSEPGLMRQLFENRARPLYGQAEPLRPERLSDGALAEHIAGRFERTARSVGDALAPMLATARGHPQRAMLLANRLWQRTPERGDATSERWSAALRQTRSETAPELDALWRSLTPTEQKAVRAIQETGGTLYRPRALERLQLPKTSAQKAIRNLIGKGLVERAAERYEIVDPLFALWVKGLGDAHDA